MNLNLFTVSIRAYSKSLDGLKTLIWGQRMEKKIGVLKQTSQNKHMDKLAGVSETEHDSCSNSVNTKRNRKSISFKHITKSF